MWDSFGHDFVNFYFVPGLVLGCCYALGAVGLTFTLSILRFGNFAHGEMMMMSGYLAWTMSLITLYLFGWSLHPVLAAIPTIFIIVFIYLLIDKYFYKPFRGSSRVMLALASFGMMLIVRSAVQTIYGAEQIAFTVGIEQPNEWIRDLTKYLGITLLFPNKYLWIFSGTILISISLHYFLNYTRMGKAMRAVADSIELARVSGIDVESVVKVTWVVGAICAAAGGVFIVMDAQFLDTNFGFRMLLPMFAAAILGGIGRPFGALLGGLIIGLAEELMAYPWVGDVPLINPGYKAAVGFFIMITMLIVRPSGLFKGRML